MDDPSNEPFYPHILILANEGSEYEFQLTGGPLDEHFGNRAVMAHIGRGLLAWARMEQHLNLLVMTVNREHNSEDLYNDRHPNAFWEKLELANKWFCNHRPLLERKEDFAQVVGHLREMATIRNTIAHGILESLDRATGQVIFKNITAKKGRFRVTRSEIHIDLFPRIAVVANAANAYLTDLTHKLCCEEGEKLLREPSQTK